MGKLGVVGTLVNLATGQLEAGESQIGGQPGPLNEPLAQNNI